MVRSFLRKMSKSNRTRSADRLSRRLKVETLEDRKLMATFAGMSAFDGADNFDDNCSDETCEVGMVVIAQEGPGELTETAGKAEITPQQDQEGLVVIVAVAKEGPDEATETAGKAEIAPGQEQAGAITVNTNVTSRPLPAGVDALMGGDKDPSKAVAIPAFLSTDDDVSIINDD